MLYEPVSKEDGKIFISYIIEVLTPKITFEEQLQSLCRRWHKRDIEDISALCNRMGATRDQRANAIRAYMAERQVRGE